MKKIRMRKYALVHVDTGRPCAGRSYKTVSRRPIPKRPIYCPYGHGLTLWRRAERVTA